MDRGRPRPVTTTSLVACGSPKLTASQCRAAFTYAERSPRPGLRGALDPVVLDTDVAPGLQKGTLTQPLATRLIGREVLITFVTWPNGRPVSKPR